MNILITNDDGIHAEGLWHLVHAVKEFANVIVIAPDRERSATSHMITIHNPLRTTKSQIFGSQVQAWAVDGTPADCVKLGVSSILEQKPDLVLSGINAGPNLGMDVMYSGTVAGAVEATMHDIPGIAFSLSGWSNFNFSAAAIHAEKIIKSFLHAPINNRDALNVNFPSLCEEKQLQLEICITKLGIRKYKNFYEQRIDPRGLAYYWLAGDLIEIKNDEDSDIVAVSKGYISITPLKTDFTNNARLGEMKSWSIKGY